MKNCSTVAGILGLLAMTGVLLLRQDAATGGENPPPAGSTLVGWGTNERGETDIPDGNDFVAVAAGELYSLALRADGSLAGWGFNQYGQTDVPAGNDFVAVSAGFAHGLALRADGSLVGWGGPADVPQGSFVAIAAGGAHSLAVRKDGSLVGWGGWNWFGEADVPAGDFVAVAAGYFHSLALRADGSLVGWGSNRYGQTNVPPGDDFVAVTAGYFHSLALRADGSLVGWGWNPDGRADVPEGTGFVAIAAGYAHSLALRIDGSLVGWGSNEFGATDVPEGNDFVAVAAGAAHSLAIRSSNTPPVVQVATDVTTLWPANLAMVPVTITTTVVDRAARPDDLLVFCWVSSSQPDNTTGSRRHTGDVDGRDGFIAPVAIDLEHVGQGRYEATIRLRAERAGKDKTGRVYSIRVEAWSPSRLSSAAVCSVHVPHTLGRSAGK